MNKLVNRRILLWVMFLALIGAFVQTKSAIITFEDVLIGLLAGGAVGYFLGSVISLMTKK